MWVGPKTRCEWGDRGGAIRGIWWDTSENRFLPGARVWGDRGRAGWCVEGVGLLSPPILGMAELLMRLVRALAACGWGGRGVGLVGCAWCMACAVGGALWRVCVEFPCVLCVGLQLGMRVRWVGVGACVWLCSTWQDGLCGD